MKKTFKQAKLCIIVALLCASVALGAQESSEGSEIDMNLDSLFGEEVVEIASDAPTATGDPVTAALKSDKVRIGGSFYGTLAPTATWTSLWDGGSDLLDPDRKDLSSSLKSTLFFDARPKEDFRVYGSVKTSWPFSTATTDSIEVPNISIFELFADFSMNDKLFFRFGKSTVKWGVGYFWSPADVINLEQINLLDAEAQREGPVNFRVHIPVPGTQNNFYMYTILDENSVAFETTALAAKAEFLLGNYELGLGAYYRYDTAERAMLTLTGPIGNLDVFGEAMVSRGSGKTFVTDIQTTSPYTIATSSTADNRENLYFSASAGFLYNDSNNNMTAIGQYYYNGEGYSTATKDALVAKAKLAIASAVATPDPAAAAALSASLASLIYGSGQHYAALSFSKGELFTEDFSASIIAVANLSDWSGIVKPTFSYAVHDNLSLALSPTFFFGPADGEYAFLAGGDAVTLSLGATVSGSF
ncbi:MAG TPA: hypothetical protein VN445_08145 [Rectinemataceae bacterium]|nr:hypothetical protein [Rectinemataceae bacterium]